MKTKLLLCAVGFASFLLVEKAQSQTLVTTFIEINPNVPVNGTYDGSFFQDYPSGLAVFADFTGFCVEPLQALSYGQAVTYDIQDPDTLANVASIARLVGGYLASGQTAEDAAAVQWAIWEVVAELSPTKSLVDGNVLISADSPLNPNGSKIALLADYYLQNIENFDPVTLTYLTNETNQDVIAWLPVPEPSTVGLAALSALMILRRRR